MSLVPVLPTALLEFLESPVPLMAGVTKKQYLKIRKNLNQQEIDDKIWFNCSTGDITWSKQQEVECFSFGNL